MTVAGQVYTPGDKHLSILKAPCYSDQQLLVVSTYVHSEDQTPPVRFLVDSLYKQFCHKPTRNWTYGLSALVYSMTSVYHRIDVIHNAVNGDQHCWLQLSTVGLPQRNFSMSRVERANVLQNFCPAVMWHFCIISFSNYCSLHILWLS